jgi:hypothetical protein
VSLRARRSKFCSISAVWGFGAFPIPGTLPITEDRGVRLADRWDESRPRRAGGVSIRVACVLQVIESMADVPQP